MVKVERQKTAQNLQGILGKALEKGIGAGLGQCQILC